jgi:hypothetical protein
MVGSSHIFKYFPRAARAAVAALFAAAPLMGLSGVAADDGNSDPLLQGFRNPPDVARPQVWWHWISGNVSLEGARLDLAWLHRVGIAGVHVFAGGGLGEPQVIQPPVDFMGAEWQRIFREATRNARDFGMEVTIAGSPGWSETGGTWVAPDDAMKKYVWSDTDVVGGKPFSGRLASPPTATGPFLGVKRVGGRAPATKTPDLYRDALVIAFPTPPAESSTATARFSSSAGPIDLSPVNAGDLAVAVDLPIAEGQTAAWVQATFDAPTAVAALTLGLSAVANVDIYSGNDAADLKLLLHGAADGAEHPSPEQTYAFPATRARIFRVVLTVPLPKPPLPDLPTFLVRSPAPVRSFAITRLAFSKGARVDRFEAKAGFQSTLDSSASPTPPAAAGAAIPLGAVVDLTGELQPDGHLRWTPPPGRWTVLRFGWSLTGQVNGPAEKQDTGLEVDKLNADLVRSYLERYLTMYRSALKADLGAATVGSLLTDSWEAGVQNWTANLPAQFAARRGYDPTPYLPVLTGRVVADSVTSEKFLWDFRRTLQELLVDNHYGVLATVLHEHGMQYYTEAQGDTPREIGDGMTIKSRADLPTAEFWYRPFATAPGEPSLEADLLEAASAAHVYGKPLVAAEALTVAAGEDPWAFSPAMLKPVADEIFAHGVNRMLLHESHHQPLLDKAPGLSLAFFGQFFNRNDTWAEDAGAWVSYLARTSYLLQQGHFCADVAYFYGEERNLTEINQKHFVDTVPDGYGFDYINPEALLTLLSVRDGKLETPSGMHYRVLYLPDYVDRLTLPAMRKIRDLVSAGAIIVGRKPGAGLGLQGGDAEVRSIADEMWGSAADADARRINRNGIRGSGTDFGGARSVGKGRVYGDDDLQAALTAENITPDIAIVGAAPGSIASVHRHGDGVDLYFLSNRDNVAWDAQVSLRVPDKSPELWRSEDGSAEPLSYQLTERGIQVPLHLRPHEAVFVVLRRPARARSWHAPADTDSVLVPLDGPWAVRFQADRGAPEAATFDRLIDWSASPDSGIKYFSGRGTYARQLTVARSWIRPGRRLVLDLGDVRELASVSVDGHPMATLWHAPYEVDMTAALTPGSHRIEIGVVNLWANRLIGDRQPGANPIAFAPQSPYRANSPLLSSGLLGPVRLLARDTF